MSTSSGNENHNSDFLQFESLSIPKSLRFEPSAAAQSTAADAEQVDVEQEINSLFAMVNAAVVPAQQVASEPTDPKMLQKIRDAQQLLTDINRENQAKVVAIEQNVERVQELRHRSEKLAKFSKLQVQQVQEILKSFEQVRQEIVVALDRFGGYEQIQPLLQQMNQAKNALQQAQRQLQNHQNELYRSLQQIQQQVENRSANAESFLLQHKADLNSLLSSVQVDRQQLMAMQNSVAEQLKLSSELNGRLAEKSTLFQNSMTEVNKNFTSLSESVQHEKQQFYQLTADLINKTDTSRSQFADMTKQVEKNGEAMKSLQADVNKLNTAFEQEVKEEVGKLNSLYDEMIATWSDTRRKQGSIDQRQRLFQNWLLSLTAAVIILSLGIIMQLLK
jgi:chromosome segregation ATPase